MYEDLIETLRFCAKNGYCHDCPYEKPCAGTMGDGLYCEAADAIEELSKPRWIPVTERLPEKEGEYLTYSKSGDVCRNAFLVFPDGMTKWYHNYEIWGGITHWMPLPSTDGLNET